MPHSKGFSGVNLLIINTFRGLTEGVSTLPTPMCLLPGMGDPVSIRLMLTVLLDTGFYSD